jgi:hypothetical protein
LSLLATIRGTACTLSYVVKRSLHRRHSRRRRMPSGDSRESTTFDSSFSQDGQFMFAKFWLRQWPRGAGAAPIGNSANQKRY